MEECFLNLEDATESQELEYLKHGKHEVTIVEAKVAPLKEGKNAVLRVVFKDETGGIAPEVFNLHGKTDEATRKLKGRVITLAKAAGFEDAQIKVNFNIGMLVGKRLRVVLNIKQYLKNGVVQNGTHCKFAGFAERLDENRISYNEKDDELIQAPMANSILESVANQTSPEVNSILQAAANSPAYGSIESYVTPQEQHNPEPLPF